MGVIDSVCYDVTNSPGRAAGNEAVGHGQLRRQSAAGSSAWPSATQSAPQGRMRTVWLPILARPYDCASGLVHVLPSLWA